MINIMHRQHLESLSKKLTSHVTLLRQIAGLGWGSGETMLRSLSSALVHSIAEYCVLAWCLVLTPGLIDWEFTWAEVLKPLQIFVLNTMDTG